MGPMKQMLNAFQERSEAMMNAIQKQSEALLNAIQMQTEVTREQAQATREQASATRKQARATKAITEMAADLKRLARCVRTIDGKGMPTGHYRLRMATGPDPPRRCMHGVEALEKCAGCK